MAIQFHCPSCEAMIRVPDTAAGKKGTCPQCSEKLLVPDVVPAASAAVPATASKASSNKGELPRLDLSSGQASGGRQPPDSSTSSVPAPNPAATNGVVGLSPLVEAPAARAFPNFDPITPAHTGLPPLTVGATETSVAGSLKQKATLKRRKSQGAWIVPAICVVGFIGFLAWFFWKSQPKMEGALEAHAVQDLEVQPGLISGDISGLKKADLDEVLRHLKAEPARWSSTTSRMTLKGTDKGVEVSIDNGTASHFVSVEPLKNPVFLAYVTEHSDELDKPRLASIAQHAPKLFAAWKHQFDKHESIADQKTHRDLVALPTLVTGVGYHLEAVVRGTAHPCVYEDSDGKLYFLLPNATKSFTLQGRHGAKGLSIPANFTVKIAGSSTAASRQKSSKSKSKEEREADNQGMNPELDKPEPDEAETDPKKKAKSAGEALKMGLGSMLSDEMPDKPAAQYKTKPKKPGMMDDSEEMMNEGMPAKPPAKKPTSKAMPKDGMDEEMMDGEMPAKPKAKPKAKTE